MLSYRRLRWLDLERQTSRGNSQQCFELTTYRQRRFAAGEATRLRVAFAEGAARGQLGNPTEIAGDTLQHVTGSSAG
jgi:hypothetical protein